MSHKIALVGNPNSGKTTLFNALTGANQYVGNWPGVTVEKKEGKLRHNRDITVTDLPGIYSLSPYSPEEVIARSYLIDEHPSAILNIVDGTNIERNLLLTTQLVEMGIPVVVAINMIDAVNRSGNRIDTQKLSRALGCQVVQISALRGTGIEEAIDAVIKAIDGPPVMPQHSFSGCVEHTLAHIEEAVLHHLPEEQQRWYAIKLFERDQKIIQKLDISAERIQHIEGDIVTCERTLDDDSEGIITAERYTYIDKVISECLVVNKNAKISTSQRIDRVVTNRWLALPIFVAVMFLVYFISVTSIGALVTDFTNDGLFGDGWHLAGIGAGQFEDAMAEFEPTQQRIDAYITAAEEAGIDTELTLEVRRAITNDQLDSSAVQTFVASCRAGSVVATIDGQVMTIDDWLVDLDAPAPEPGDYGVWVPGIPALLSALLQAVGCAEWLQSLIIDGIVAGVGAVLGFVPQLLILFIFLALLEGCGYLARVAFILDRIFRRFGLSGKSFIPILIGTGCGVPGLMASRTIENDRDRKMTLITTTFVPCSAKLPIIALIAGALFEGAWWVAPSAYFIGFAAIICSGIILKKTAPFRGEVAPFIMELPEYRRPTVGFVLHSVWERGWSFIKKAGTIILLATVLIWFGSSFGFDSNGFGMVDMSDSLLAWLGGALAWIFAPLGWGDWQSTVAAITGLIAKENVVGTFGILYRFAEVSEEGNEIWTLLAASFSGLSAFSFLVFNLLCAPCFAAMGAIRREMNSTRWFVFAIAYQCLLAYIVALCVYQLGMLFGSGVFGVGTIFAFVFALIFAFMLFCPTKKIDQITGKIHQVFAKKIS